jgi:hypothetical protein
MLYVFHANTGTIHTQHPRCYNARVPDTLHTGAHRTEKLAKSPSAMTRSLQLLVMWALVWALVLALALALELASTRAAG